MGPKETKLAEVARSSLSEKANKRKREGERRAAASQRKYEMMPVSRASPTAEDSTEKGSGSKCCEFQGCPNLLRHVPLHKTVIFGTATLAIQTG